MSIALGTPNIFIRIHIYLIIHKHLERERRFKFGDFLMHHVHITLLLSIIPNNTSLFSNCSLYYVRISRTITTNHTKTPYQIN